MKEDKDNPFKCPSWGNHDLENPYRVGRANYQCRHCGENITLLLVYLLDAVEESKKLKNI